MIYILTLKIVSSWSLNEQKWILLHLRKEKFHNMHDMLDMEPSDIRNQLQTVKRCIQNPDSCNQKQRNEIVEQLDNLVSLTQMI